MKHQRPLTIQTDHRTIFQNPALFFGAFIFSIFFTLFTVIFWYSRRNRQSKEENESVSLKSLEMSQQLNTKATFKIMIEHVQPQSNIQISSTSILRTKKKPTKNLLERRGSNNPLKLSIANKHRRSLSPPIASPTDDYLKTATSRLTIEQLHQRAEETSLSEEFWAIPSNHLEEIRICGIGIKNRYGTIVANEHSRVCLTEIGDDPVSSYINANYIRAYPDQNRKYIATQGPLVNTISDFYRMIWQENVPVIVMMTRLYENSKSKCERYIPELLTQSYGSFNVRINSMSSENGYEFRRLTLQLGNEEREIHHYWYTTWPDHSCPEQIEPLIDLIENVEKSRIELNKIDERTGPIVVHCSAGIGRTGCFIAISNGMKQIVEEKAVDVVRILCNLRQDRGGMIQTDDQYRFVYRALSEYARRLS